MHEISDRGCRQGPFVASPISPPQPRLDPGSTVLRRNRMGLARSSHAPLDAIRPDVTNFCASSVRAVGVYFMFGTRRSTACRGPHHSGNRHLPCAPWNWPGSGRWDR